MVFVIKIGIILPRVDIPIICLAKPIHVKNTGRRRIIYISDVDTHIFESLFINWDIKSIGEILISWDKSV